jgi:hypothetical protein
MLSREFAGETRELALRYPRNWPTVRVGCYETERFGNLAALWELGKRNLLGDGHVRHVLAHALAGADNPVALLKAHRLVEEEMQGKPLAAFQALALEVIIDAYAGAD